MRQPNRPPAKLPGCAWKRIVTRCFPFVNSVGIGYLTSKNWLGRSLRNVCSAILLAVHEDVKRALTGLASPIGAQQFVGRGTIDAHFKGKPTAVRGMPPLASQVFAGTGSFAGQIVVPFRLHLADAEDVDGMGRQLSFALLLRTQFPFFVGPLGRCEDVEIDAVTLVVEAVKGHQRHIARSADARGGEFSGFQLDRLDPVVHRLAVGEQHGNIGGCGGGRVIDRSEHGGQQRGTIKHRNSLRIVRHGFRAQRHGKSHLDAITILPRAADAHVARRAWCPPRPVAH